METICHKNGKVYTSDFLCHVSKSQNLLDNLLHFFLRDLLAFRFYE